jgi:RHS repeat-associated protein
MCTPESYTYDPWGNLLTLGPNTTTQSNYTGCTQESGFNYTGSVAANNRLAVSGFAYDSAGNMTASPGATYTYDAENHLITTHGVTYAYNGDGKRLTKSSGMMYWYGLNSDPLIETDLSNNLKAHYIFFNGQRVASENSSNSVDWYFADHLGTARLVFSLNGDDQSDFYPFGGERTITTGAGNHYKFTSKERDSESGLDNFGARYNSSSMGRWMSPDPKGNVVAESSFPQTWNLYSYVLNNPLNFIDPDGFYCAYLNDAGTGVERNGIDENSSSGECNGSGGYWIAGNYGGGSWVNVNVDAGTATGLGYDSSGNPEVSNAGAMGSNNWGAWTQTSASWAQGPSLKRSYAGVAIGGTIVCQVLEPCGLGEDLVLAGGMLLGGATLIQAALQSQNEQSKIKEVAREKGVDPDQLAEAVHAEKDRTDRRGGDNLSMDKIRQIADEIKGGGWWGGKGREDWKD